MNKLIPSIAVLAFIGNAFLNPLSAQWVETSKDSVQADVRFLHVANSMVFAGTQDGIYRTDDWGEVWRDISGDQMNGDDVRAITSSGSFIFAGDDDFVFRSADWGITWDTTALSGEIGALYYSSPYLYAGLRSGSAYRSEDNGETWTALDTDEDYPRDIRTIYASGDTVFAGTSSDGLYRSYDAGNSWEVLNGGLLVTTEDIRTIIRSDDLLYITTDVNGVMRSEYPGESWEYANTGIMDEDPARGLASMNGTIYVGFNSGGGIYKLENSEVPWESMNDGTIENFEIRTIAAYGTYVFAGTNSGKIFRNPVTPSKFEEIPAEELSFLLYPNPTDGLMQIKSPSDIQGSVEIQISDMAGRLVRSMHAEALTNVNLDLRNLPAGSYLVNFRIMHGNKSSSGQKMVFKSN